VGFRWCKEARDEFDAASRQRGGSALKGETLAVLKRMVAGALDVTETHKAIRPAEVGDWTILYTGGDGAYVGLLYVRCAADRLPEEAYQLAESRLANLRC
jgi:hypothetical protein